jgi:hypothetical protein
MRTRFLHCGSLGFALSALSWMFASSTQVTAAPPVNAAAPDADTAAMPDWKTVEDAAKKHFRALPNYKPGDILSQGQVKPLLAQLAKSGWKISDQRELLVQICPDNDFVVQQLRTKNGQKFMRSTGGSAEQYDYLRRLADTKGGDRQITNIMALPNGNDVLTALTKSKAGKDISRRLADGPRTQGYDTPTGYIYTEAQVLERIKESYDRDVRTAR